jgi:putative transcriptional regulator
VPRYRRKAIITVLAGSTGKAAMKTRIKEYRNRHNLTQEKLADMVGVRRETIIFLEQGKYNPSLRLAYNVARALHTTIEELFILDD